MLWHPGLYGYPQSGVQKARAAVQKKSLFSSERDEAERARWRERIARIAPERLVFVDECGTHTSMVRIYARAPKGERAYGSVPRNRGTNTTLLASMSVSGMGEAMAIEGSTTKEVFEAYVEHFLAPKLEDGQVVILDNLGAHKVSGLGSSSKRGEPPCCSCPLTRRTSHR